MVVDSGAVGGLASESDSAYASRAAQVTPVVTIVVPTFNAAGTLARTLESVFAPGCPGVELIVVDGGSADGTVETLRGYVDRIDRWISEPDGGVYDAMNKGVALGRGDWFYFIGAGDSLLPGFCRAVERLQDPTTLYYGDAWLPERGFRYDGPFSPFKLAVRNICHQAIFYPRGLWERHRYDLRYPVLADYALNLRCFTDPQVRFEYLPEMIAVFEDRDGLSQTRPDTTFESDRMEIIRQGFPMHVYVRAVLWLKAVDLLQRTGLYDFVLNAKNAIIRWFRGAGMGDGAG